MGKLIAVIGNCGTGKTTITKRLCERGHFLAFLEQHKERPFQEQFSTDLKKYSLSNQIDYMLFRAEQELQARQKDITGVQDGGLDQDFHVFTRLFRNKGILEEDEYRLCERLYATLRQVLPMPELFIKLSAPRPILVERREKRQRSLDIVETKDLEGIESLIQDWMSKMGSTPVIDLDTSVDDPLYEGVIDSLLKRVGEILIEPTSLH
jgi:deoxyadenosine/deoxycytidine kinase